MKKGGKINPAIKLMIEIQVNPSPLYFLIKSIIALFSFVIFCIFPLLSIIKFSSFKRIFPFPSKFGFLGYLFRILYSV